MRGMSSDGSTDKPRSARPGRGEDRDLASIALGVLLILAVVATVVMVISDNPVWMRVGTLAALWAAFIGAFLVARYRRQAAAESARVRDLHTVYELQLEREISARREHELVVEKDLRDSIRLETSESVLALRHEIAALREQLGAMGVTIPEDRFAVGGHAPAAQIGAGNLQSVPSERVEPRRRPSESSAARPGQTDRPSSGAAQESDAGRSGSGAAAGSGATGAPAAGAAAGAAAAGAAAGAAAKTGTRTGTPVSGVGPGATPSTERTEKLSPVADRDDTSSTGTASSSGIAPGSSSASASGSAPGSSSASTSDSASATPSGANAGSGANTDSGEIRRPAVRPTGGSGRAARRAAEAETSSVPSESTPSPSQESSAGDSSSGEQSAPASRHGQGSGLSVAELMARLGGDDAPSGGRRRRRAED